jgi:hypothetical protein
MTQALSNPSEPRERWFGVEFDFPHELDGILGMTNNKQSYTRLEQVLKNGFKDYQAEGESVQQCIERIRREDAQLAICLEIAWKIDEIWRDTRRTHLNMRPEVVSKKTDHVGDGSADDPKASPQTAAEAVASGADGKDDPSHKPTDDESKEKLREQVILELVTANVPKVEAEQIAARIVDRGFTYAIVNRRGLGSPFFNIGSVVDAKLIELNEDHGVHPYLLSTIDDNALEEVDQLKERLRRARIAVFLMLEAWAKVEAEVRGRNPVEHRRIQLLREDWGRSLEQFIEEMHARQEKATE